MRRFFALLLLSLLLVGCTSAPPSTAPQSAPTPTPAPDTTAPSVSPAPAPQPTAQDLYHAAQQLLQSGDVPGAEGKLQQAIALDPTSADALHLLAYVEVHNTGHAWPPGMTSSYDQAIETAKRAVAANPASADPKYLLGLAQLAAGQYELSLSTLRAAAKAAPQQEDVAVAVGLALLGTGRVDDAIAACKQAIEMQQDYAPAHHCLDAAGNGYKVIPATEAALGQYVYQQKGFVAKKSPADAVQQVQINPPWTCAQVTSDGYRVDYVGCGQAQAFFTGWQFSSPGLGTTPAGVGVGSPWGAPAKAYGATDMTDGAYHYRVGDLHLIIQGSVEQGVQSLTFARVTPLFVIEELIHQR